MSKQPGSKPANPGPIAATAVFRDKVRDALNRVEPAAARIEELMGRTDATFLGGSLLPVMTYALLHQAREETLDAVANVDKVEKGEPSDVIDRADFFASALGEMAALLKIFTTMELDSGEEQSLKEDWEKLADDMQALATIIQNATEEFEDALDAAEPPDLNLVNIQRLESQN